MQQRDSVGQRSRAFRRPYLVVRAARLGRGVLSSPTYMASTPSGLWIENQRNPAGYRYCFFGSMARRSGFCGLQSSSRRMCQTRPGWYLTPKRASITLATRVSVHRSVANPAACGPCRRISSSATFCSAVNREGRPGWGLARNASGPPSLRAPFHRHTDEGEAPTRRAISRTPLPSWSKLPPIRRRTSNDPALPFGLIESQSYHCSYGNASVDNRLMVNRCVISTWSGSILNLV